MGIIKKVCGKLGLSDTSEMDELFDEEFSEEEGDSSMAKQNDDGSNMKPQATNFSSGTSNPSNVVDIQAAINGGLRSKMKVVVIEPKSFDDVQQVANYLKEK